MKIMDWKSASDCPRLAESDCQVWLARLDEEDPGTFWKILSTDERVRAERFRIPREANRFSMARGILRTLLGQYLSCDPGQLVFSYGAHGKPDLAEAREARISFNVSHSGGLAVYAIAQCCRVGVDVEEIHPIGDLEATASIFLAQDELSQFKESPAAGKLEHFFDLWTSKEAILKAYGDGFSRPAKNIFTEFRESGSRECGQMENSRGDRLTLFVPMENYRGALACL